MKFFFQFSRIFAALALILSLASPVFAIDATRAPRTEITPKSPIPTGTVATWPLDAAVPPGWLTCNGQAVPSSYPELRALMGSVPNYNNRQFLRGSTSGAGSSVADSTRSHTHVIPAHSHTVSGTASAHSVNVASQRVTGTAEGQEYSDDTTDIFTYDWTSNSEMLQYGEGLTNYFGHSEKRKRTASSSVSGQTAGGTYSTSGGSITGVTNAVGQTTNPTGDAETAPVHTLVKYIIKAD